MPVTRTDDTWTYICPGCRFVSSAWTTKKLATERGTQHEAEHATGQLMQPMDEFIGERTT